MAHGLEARAPYLDHRFVQRLLALPARERYTRPPKLLLRAAIDPRLPQNLFDRKKRGFNPPLREWLRGGLATRFDGLGKRLQDLTCGQLAAGAVDSFARRYVDGAERLAEQVLQLLILDESLSQLSSLPK
jgi:asparagine synthase (glutamine-hydrolysing)